MGWGSIAFDTTERVAGVMIEAIGISLEGISYIQRKSAEYYITM